MSNKSTGGAKLGPAPADETDTSSHAMPPIAPSIRIKAASTDPSPIDASPAAPKQRSKQDLLAAMLLRDEGATLDAMIEATGWLKHTARAALSGLKKKGYGLSSDKIDGVRTYRAVAPE